ncbi:MAG: hypothetical protein KJT01_02265 [Gemmatimonadetes bacterium]|nr:hypothetical protein [Gemmatimonadota bacterium]
MAAGIPARLTKTRAELRAFAFTVGGAFAVLGALAWGWRGHAATGQALLGAAAALAAAGVVAPHRLAAVERGWMALALAISKVTTPVFMGAVYLLVITPGGVLRRTLGARVLEPSRGRATAWVAVRRSPSMERQF